MIGRRTAVILLAPLLVAACSTKVRVYSPQGSIRLPGTGGNLGLDEMAYSSELKRFIVPAGPSGEVYLIDPDRGKVTATIRLISGRAGDRGKGVTSAAYGLGFIFVGDRTHRTVDVIDADSHRVVARRTLGSRPDTVRYADSQKEVWVTEPEAGRIEIFRVHPDARPVLSKRTDIPIPGGPESLAVDDQRDMAYTNSRGGKTVAVDMVQERVIERWPNTCGRSRGLALAPARGLLFVGCREGKVASLDVAHRGTLIASVKVGKGVDIIAYDAMDNLLYVPAAGSRMLTLLSSAPSGRLRVLAKFRTAADAHCVVSDESGHAYVCDPTHRRLLIIHYHPTAPGR